ncbi:MAG: right-handed parallel beta-helix repeat-containing protein [Acidimicrobiia bacterium]
MNFSRSTTGGVLALLVSALSIAASPVGAGTDSTHRIPDRIDRTGRADVTSQMQQFLASVPDGSVIEFPRGARYRMEDTLEVRDRRDLTFEGHGATVFATTEGDRERSQWRIVGGAGIVFRNLIVRGANPQGGIEEEAYRDDLEAQHGFEIAAVRNLELDRVTVTDVYGDFVLVGPNSPLTWSQNIWIHDSSFARNGRQGIAVTAGRNVVIERNDIRQTRRSTFDLEPNTARGGAERIHILDNTVGVGRLLFLASHGNGPVNDVVVSGNKLNGHVLNIDVVPAENDRRARFWITDNTSSTSSVTTPMRFWQIDGVVIRDNTQPVERASEVGVRLNDVCGARITGNDFGLEKEPLRVTGDPCEARISMEPPPPPPIAGRDATVDDGRSERRQTTRDAEREDDGGNRTVVLTGVALLVIAVAVAVVLTRYRARGRRS